MTQICASGCKKGVFEKGGLQDIYSKNLFGCEQHYHYYPMASDIMSSDTSDNFENFTTVLCTFIIM